MQRLLSLDYVLEHTGLQWLPTDPEKVGTLQAMVIERRLARRVFVNADQGPAHGHPARCRSRHTKRRRRTRAPPIGTLQTAARTR